MCFQATKGSPYNPGSLLPAAVSNVICAMLFGHKFEYDDVQFKKMLDSLETFLRLSEQNRKDDIKNSNITPDQLKADRQNFVQVCDDLNDFYRMKVKLAKDTINDDDARDFLRMYMKELPDYNKQARITENWALSMTSNFIQAGSETTASTLKWALLLMANHPEVQNKIHEEIDAVYGKGEHRSAKLLL